MDVCQFHDHELLNTMERGAALEQVLSPGNIDPADKDGSKENIDG